MLKQSLHLKNVKIVLNLVKTNTILFVDRIIMDFVKYQKKYFILQTVINVLVYYLGIKNK
jgi:hypothetical protein